MLDQTIKVLKRQKILEQKKRLYRELDTLNDQLEMLKNAKLVSQA